MNTSDYQVIRADSYSEEVATQIGLMMPHLSSQSDGTPIPQAVLDAIINSSDADLLLAVRKDNHQDVGGVAVVNQTRGVIVKDDGSYNIKTWLEDFVVTTPRQGIGSLLWDEIIAWSAERGASVLNFTSNPKKAGAHKFYLSKPGVRIRATGETAYFSVDIQQAVADL